MIAKSHLTYLNVQIAKAMARKKSSLESLKGCFVRPNAVREIVHCSNHVDSINSDVRKSLADPASHLQSGKLARFIKKHTTYNACPKLSEKATGLNFVVYRFEVLDEKKVGGCPLNNWKACRAINWEKAIDISGKFEMNE